MSRTTHISPGLFAAIRDGDMTQAQVARLTGVTKQAVKSAFRTFRARQAAQRSKQAMMAADGWLDYCIKIGFSHDDLSDLDRLWWQHHDENGNLIPRRAY